MKKFSVTEIFDSSKNSEHVPLIDVRTPLSSDLYMQRSGESSDGVFKCR